MKEVQELIKVYSETINTISGDNHFLAAAISVSLIGLFWKIYSWFPKLYYFIKRQFIITLELNCDARESNYIVYTNFVSWHSSSKYLKQSKNFTVIDLANTNSKIFKFNATNSLEESITCDSECEESSESEAPNNKKHDYKLVAGYGLHWFFLDGRLYWFNRVKNSGNDASGLMTENITLHTFSLDKDVFLNLIKKFTPVEKITYKEKRLYLYNNKDRFDGWYCTRSGGIQGRKLSSVYIDKNIKQDIIEKITKFYSNRKWYLDNGISHKLIISLSGESGTGKSSLIKALATEYADQLYRLNLKVCSDSGLEQLFEEIQARGKSFISIEDIDSVSSVLKRSKNIENSASVVSDKGVLTLSGVLNCLDGILPLDNIVVFITTNHYDLLDEALTRKGRIDLNYVLGKLTDTEIKEFIFSKYNRVIENLEFSPIKGCDLQDLFLQNLHDCDNFISQLRTISLLKVVN